MVVYIIKIDQLAFIRDLIIEKRLTKCNANIILIKAGLSIEIFEPGNYNKTNFHIYQQLIKKLIYLVCRIKLEIVFIVRQLSMYNVDLKKKHLRVAKRIVRYLKRIMQMGLIFRQEN